MHAPDRYKERDGYRKDCDIAQKCIALLTDGDKAYLGKCQTKEQERKCYNKKLKPVRHLFCLPKLNKAVGGVEDECRSGGNYREHYYEPVDRRHDARHVFCADREYRCLHKCLRQKRKHYNAGSEEKQ